MSRFFLLASIIVLEFGGIAHSQEGPKFKPVILPDAIHYVQNFSEDKLVGAMVFDNFVITTEIGRGSAQRRQQEAHLCSAD